MIAYNDEIQRKHLFSGLNLQNVCNIQQSQILLEGVISFEELWRLHFDRNDDLANLEIMKHVSLAKE